MVPFYQMIVKIYFYSQRFDNAAIAVKELAAQPEDEDLLELYALYKQSTVGDCNTGAFSQNFCVQSITRRAHSYTIATIPVNFLF